MSPETRLGSGKATGLIGNRRQAPDDHGSLGACSAPPSAAKGLESHFGGRTTVTEYGGGEVQTVFWVRMRTRVFRECGDESRETLKTR